MYVLVCTDSTRFKQINAFVNSAHAERGLQHRLSLASTSAMAIDDHRLIKRRREPSPVDLSDVFTYLLTGGLASGGFTCGLLGTCHGCL
mmetsp:Transcript_4559/g.6737  ORF Transcript_4559/g.6737 Transcript_4559/m.6737 type:complete len:89 (+) Transcript_4559:591-857(+)